MGTKKMLVTNIMEMITIPIIDRIDRYARVMWYLLNLSDSLAMLYFSLKVHVQNRARRNLVPQLLRDPSWKEVPTYQNAISVWPSKVATAETKRTNRLGSEYEFILSH